jgi:hypothetical protein
MPGDIAPHLIAEAVVALADRDLRRHPKCAPQPGIAIL